MRGRTIPIGWPRRDPRHYRFVVPNAVWEYKLKPAAGISKNTAMKNIGVLLEMGLITVEPSSYFDKHGLKWKGNNLYTILPVGVAIDVFYQRQI